MEGSVVAPPQRVCPKCARISWATGPQCPYCTANFRRSSSIAPWMLVVTALVILLGIGVMFYITIREVENRVERVETKVDTEFKTLRTDVQRQLDAVALWGAGPVPAPTATPLPTTTPAPTVAPEATETPTVEGETTPDPDPDAGATATPTPDEPEIINP